YHWDMGDNTNQNGQLNLPTRTKNWSNAGFYVARVEVSDMKGGKATESVVIRVGSPTDSGIIRGRVTQGGRGVEGVFLRGGGVQTWSDSDGSYVLPGLALGNVTVTADKAGLTFTPQFTNPVVVTSLGAFGMDFHANEAWSGGGGTVVEVVPYEVEVPIGASVGYTATAYDSTGSATAYSPTWSVTGGGSISTGGLFSATTVGGPFTVTATQGSTSGTASVTVVNADAVGITATDADAAEPSNPGQFRVRRYGSTTGALTVLYSVGGSASSGADYQALGSSVTLADGQSFADIDVTVLDDYLVEPTETVVLTLQTDAAYSIFGLEASAIVNLADDGDSGPTASMVTPALSQVGIPSGVGLALEGQASDDGLPQALQGTWRVLEAPVGGSVRFDPPSGFETMAFFGAPGLYRLAFVAWDGANEGTAEQWVAVGVAGGTFPDGTGEIVRYTLDEGTGSTAGDSAGGDNPGTLTGNPVWSSADAVAGGALVLDGAGDYVVVANSPDINESTQGLRTVALWFKASNPTSTAKQVLYEEGGTGRGLNFYLHNGVFWVGGWNNGENGWVETFLSAPLTDTGWHHAALVLDADAATTLQPGAFRGYLDGAPIGSGGGAAINAHSSPIGIGAKNGDTRYHDGNSNGIGDAFTGSIDAFHLYNRALTPYEIAELAAWENPAPGFSITGMADLDRAIVLPPTTRLLLSGSATEGGAWSVFSGPAGQATFGNTTAAASWVEMAAPGFFELRLGIDDGRVSTALPVCVHAGIASPSNPSTASEVIYYSLNENAGTTAGDAIGGDQDAPITGGAVWVPGIAGSALQFDGVDDVVEVPNASSINTSNSHTRKSIAFWFKAAATGTGGTEMLYEEGGSSRGLNVYLAGDTLYVGGWNNGTLGWDSTFLSAPIARDVWHHVVMELNVQAGALAAVDGLKLYLNGRMVAAGYASELLGHSGNCGLGAMRASTKLHTGNSNGDGNPFAGIIDEFHYFNGRVLSIDEIGALYAYGNIAASVDAGPDLPGLLSRLVDLTASLSDDGGAGTAVPNWIVLEKPDGAGASFSLPDGDGVPQRVLVSKDGYYKMRLTVFDGQATTFDQMQFSASDGPSFAGWIGDFFNLSAENREATANTDGDPFSQFYEYATGGDIFSDDAISLLGPVMQVTDDLGNSYFEVQYRRRIDHAARGLTYVVEFSNTLAPGSWSAVNGVEVGADPIDAQIEEVTIRYNTEIGPSLLRQFARLVISEN
ncbi:MAG: hypothetical protein KDK99_18865, partial [Verrucomicrobiales bacterium]|nr:hypothetical protein [Verrucomicrobiales bacterium]